MILQIAIVEDDSTQAELLKSCLEAYPSDEYTLEISVFSSAEAFLDTFEKGKYELLFLDIQLPKMDGLSCARRVRTMDKTVTLVFITSMAQFAINGYEVDARDYILKPLIYDVFMHKLDRILPLVQKEKNALVQISTIGDAPKMVRPEDLIFVEIYGHKLIYHCVSGDYEGNGKISDAEESLRAYGFSRCNRNTVVNLRFVDRVQNDEITVGEYSFLIAAPRRKDFMRDVNSWLR